MRAAGILIWGLVGLACLAGCRTSQPELKPPPQPEVANAPPMTEQRFASPNYPKEAFNNQDLFRRRETDLTNPGNPILPTRGMMNGPGGMTNPGRPY